MKFIFASLIVAGIFAVAFADDISNTYTDVVHPLTAVASIIGDVTANLPSNR